MKNEIKPDRTGQSRGILYLIALLLTVIIVSGIIVYLSRPVHVTMMAAEAGAKERAFEGGVFEASGVANVPGTDAVLFIDDGRAGEVLWMQLDRDGNQAGSVKPVKLGINLEDAEGITTDGKYFYVVSSQSKKGSDRYGIVRFTFDPESRSAASVEAVSDLKRYLVENVSALAGLGGTKARDDGLNIEGLAWDPERARLLLGLRSPVVDGHALVIAMRLRDPRGRFSYENLVADGAEAIRLPLGGLGIRSIEFDARAKAFRIIAGATESQDKTDFRLWEWDGNAERPALKELARFDRKLKPEGITRASVGESDFTFIVFDDSKYMKME